MPILFKSEKNMLYETLLPDCPFLLLFLRCDLLLLLLFLLLYRKILRRGRLMEGRSAAFDGRSDGRTVSREGLTEQKSMEGGEGDSPIVLAYSPI